MLQIDEIHDADTLRQIAVLLERENRRLHDRLQRLITELAHLRGADAAAQIHLEFLRELLAQRERALFGDSSEKRPRPATATTTVPAAPAPPRGHGPTAQPVLPQVETLHTLPEAERACPQCGGTLTELKGQTEDAEEITVVERQFVLVRHRRQKYRCRCNGCVATAPGSRCAWPPGPTRAGRAMLQSSRSRSRWGSILTTCPWSGKCASCAARG